MNRIEGNGWSLKRADIPLQRLGDDVPAGLWITSLPWPRAAPPALSLNGHTTYSRPLGCWPDAANSAPRRLLLIADGADTAPAELRLTSGAVAAAAAPPLAAAELFASSPNPHFGWERHRLRLSYGGRSIAIAMGLRTGEVWHWWEACRLVVREEDAACRVVEMGGAIPLVHSNRTSATSTYQNRWLHKHHWLYGHIQARLHANGVCELFARHVNSKFFDDGDDLQPAVPVVGFWYDTTAQGTDDLPQRWDGSCRSFNLGGVDFDVAEVARLATPEQPGRIDLQDDLMIWQPYQGCELYGGLCAMQRCTDGYIVHAAEERILRGMSRTLRFSLSLSDRSPRVARYLSPAWWYGLCEELAPAPLLPVVSDGAEALQRGRNWIAESQVEGGFEDGAVPRHKLEGKPQREYEPGWEGGMPYAQFLTAWRHGAAADYEAALRSAYHFNDLAVDHAANLVRMHGFPPVAFAVPMNRTKGCLAAFLETGDNFLCDTAEKVVETSHRVHLNAWPRLAVGRDACYLRSAVLLYRYTGNPHFKRIARDGGFTVVATQRPNGSFGDQGGGSGIHQWGGYISKPWMGLLATNGLLDYLEVIGEEPAFVETVKRFADWLMAERTLRQGILSWGYQHDYWGRRSHQQDAEGEIIELPSPIRWHEESVGRLMAFCALRYGQADYLEAWAISRSRYPTEISGHNISALLQFLPQVESYLWRSRLDTAGNLEVEALDFGAHSFNHATIDTPVGKLALARQPDGTLTSDGAVPARITTVKLR